VLGSTEKEIATVHAANADDVDKAVKAAHAAFHNPSWKKLPPPQRGVLMNKLADYIEERTKIFATSEAWDNGILKSCQSIPIAILTSHRQGLWRCRRR
jgi:aldehyde dehydrogenase (NAD(P)+)